MVSYPLDSACTSYYKYESFQPAYKPYSMQASCLMAREVKGNKLEGKPTYNSAWHKFKIHFQIIMKASYATGISLQHINWIIVQIYSTINHAVHCHGNGVLNACMKL